MDEFVGLAKNGGETKIEVMTTNDKLDALRFYKRRGFTILRIAFNQLEEKRKIEPVCSLIGDFGIPCRDEIILERSI